MSDFLKEWRNFHGELPPLSFALAKGDRWLRIHALPAGKRYPQTTEEQLSVVERANIIGGEALGDDECWLVQSGSTELGWDRGAERARDQFGLAPAGSVDFDETVWPIYVAACPFQRGRFDDLFLQIAMETALRTLWMSRRNGRVFAPYDGGFDLFFETANAASVFKPKYRDWLSARSDGL